MRLFSVILKVTLAALLLSCFARIASAQQPASPQALVTLSEPVSSTLYPEAYCGHCIHPEWDRGYLFHLEIEDLGAVKMYDKNGKKVLEARIVLQDAARVSLLTAGATHAGGILAAGGAIFNDGSNQRFIAKTDPAGRTVQSVHMGRFTTRHVCEASDGTVWALGHAMDIPDSPQADKNVLRHYSFEQGLLESFVSSDSIPEVPDAYPSILNPMESHLRCGKDRVSVYIAPAAQYIEVDASTKKVTRWSVDLSSVVGSNSRGFAVTDEGRIFLAFASDPDPNRERKHGLYELIATPGSPIAPLTAVEGIVTALDSYKTAPVVRLWGADGNSLVVSRKGDSWGLSWTKVLTAPE